MTIPQAEALHIREATEADAPAIARIYNHYITQTIITFEEDPVTAADIRQRIREVRLSGLPWLVGEQDNDMTGYAYAGKWKTRCAYRFSTEVTIYVSPGHTGHGTGTRLYTRLLKEMKDRNLHAAVGGIALPNEKSIALHEKLGFTKVAHFKEIGFKFDRWIDVGYWQRIL